MLLDRDRELAHVTDALASAVVGSGSLVPICGPIGAGRSAFLRAVADLAKLSGMDVMRAVASNAERGFPFGVLRQLCEPAVAAMSDGTRGSVIAGVPESIRPLFVAGRCQADTESLVPVEHALLHGMRHLLDVLGKIRPVVVLVDDLPWADEQSLRCLGYLANRLAGLRVVLVVAFRDGDPDSERTLVRDIVDRAHHVLRLGPLSRTAVRTLAREQFGREADEAHLAALCVATRGNPLLVRSLLTELALDGRPDDVHACRPATLRALMLSRLRDQTASARAYLGALCLLEGVRDDDLVGRLAGIDAEDCATVVRSLTKQGLILPERPPRFVHPVVREAAEELTCTADGERLHVRAAELLHRTGHPAEDVAAHLLAVPSPHDPWALDALCAAAETAAQRGSHGTAARYLRRALLDAPIDSVARGDLLVRLATVESATDTGAAARHLLEAMPLLRSVTDRAGAIVLLSPMALATVTGESADVLRDVAKELGDAEFLSGTEKELALRMEARLRYLGDGDVGELLEAVSRLQHDDRERDIRSPGGRELLAVLLHWAMMTGDMSVDEVMPLVWRVLRLESPESLRLHTALPVLVGVLAFADRGTGISAWLQVAHEDARKRRDVVADAVVGVDRALLALCRGHVGEGRVLAESSMASMGERWFDTVATLGVFLGSAALEMPDPTLARQIVALCEQRSNHPAVTTMRAMLAADGTPAALERLLDCGRQLERVGWRNPAVLPWRSRAAEVQSGLGNVEAALELAEAEVEAARAWGAPVALARGLRVLGAVTPGDAGALLTREALDVLDDVEHPVERARVELQLARVLRSSHPDEAARHAGNGRALAEACGAPELVDWSTGAGGQGRALGLTAAQSRVAEAVVSGRTNQAVADELGISSRAVEKHLTSAYRKLGIAGRPELKAAIAGLRPLHEG